MVGEAQLFVRRNLEPICQLCKSLPAFPLDGIDRPFESTGLRLGRANTAPLAARRTVNADYLLTPVNDC